MAAEITGAQIMAVINQVSLLANGDAKHVRLNLQENGEWFAVYIPHAAEKPFPPDVIKYGETLGFGYVEYDPTLGDDEDNHTRFEWLAA